MTSQIESLLLLLHQMVNLLKIARIDRLSSSGQMREESVIIGERVTYCFSHNISNGTSSAVQTT